MRSVITVFLFVGFVNAICLNEPIILVDWQLFKSNYSKYYSNLPEEEYRFKIFQRNMLLIEEHNQLYSDGKMTYELGMNEFGDMTNDEYRDMLNNNNHDETMNDVNVTFTVPANFIAPQAIDWRARGAVSPVQNQGRCRSCWAFSTTGTVEGQLYLKTGELVPLSAQNLVDCSQSFGNEGCTRGRPVKALRYILANFGIDRQSAYPYTATEGTCHFSRTDVGATVNGIINLQRGCEYDLLKATAMHGPISIILDAKLNTFQFYKQGVYDDPNCHPNDLNHAMLVVGYGSQSGLDYWLVKNSYGEKWGERGYIRIIRNKNRCGIANEALYPLV